MLMQGPKGKSVCCSARPSQTTLNPPTAYASRQSWTAPPCARPSVCLLGWSLFTGNTMGKFTLSCLMRSDMAPPEREKLWMSGRLAQGKQTVNKIFNKVL